MILKVMLRLFWMLIFLPFCILACVLRRFVSPGRKLPRLAWGVEPIINYKYWSQALANKYPSFTVVHSIYSIHSRSDFDILRPNLLFMPYVNFIWSIWRFDILHFSYNGWFLGKTPLSGIEPYLLKLARVKVVVCPYGSDAFVIRWIRDISAQTCLLLSYPELALNQDKIEAQVRRWVKHADLCFSSLMCPDGLGRWDFITPNCITVDTSTLKAKVVFNESSGKPSESPVVIAHCPNHRGVKGTEFVIEAVNKLKAEGLNVELLLIEGMKNSELLDILRLKADILLDQLILPGYGMNATEAMALGMPVIANVGIEDYSLMYRRFSYYSQCPIISSNPETILDNLRMLITTPLKRKELGLQSRKFAEKYHSPEFFFFLFENVYRKIWNKEKVDLMRLFHPVVGTYQPREALNE